MRELTLSEIELVAGGGQSSSWGDQWVDDIVVIGDPGGGGWTDWGDYGWDDWGDYHYDGGGSGGGDTGAGNGQDPVKNCAADEQARQAAAMFFAAAAAEGQHVAYRERAAFIIRNDDGTYGLSGYAEGAPMAGAVSPDPSGLTPANAVGMIHNHPGGGAQLSAPDRDLLTNYQSWINEYGNGQEFRMYLMSNDGKIYVYDVDNMNQELSQLEVSGGC